MELEPIIIQLQLQAEQFASRLGKVEQETKDTAAKMGQSFKEVGRQAEDTFGKLASAATQWLASWGIKNWLQQSAAEWSKAEMIAIRLESTLKSNGRAVQSLTQDYQDFANQLQDTTTAEDDAVLSLLDTAESFGLTGDAAKKATKDAIALGKGSTDAAQGLLRVTTAMAQGDIKRAMMFSRMIPQLRGVKDQTEFMSKFQKLVNSGLETAAKIADTYQGRVQQLANAYGNLQEEIGKVVADGLKPVIEGLKMAVKWFQDLSEGTKTFVVVLAAATAGAVALAAAITAAGIAWNLLFGGSGIVIGAIVTVGAALGGLIVSMGGMKKSWEQLSKLFKTASDWVRPLVRQMGNLLETARRTAKGMEAAFVVSFKVIGGSWARTLNGMIAATKAASLPMKIALLEPLIAAEFALAKVLTLKIPKSQAELAMQMANLAGSYAKFRKDRLAEIFKDTEDENKDNVGDSFANSFKEANKELQKFDAALKGSVESYARIQEFLDRQEEEKGGAARWTRRMNRTRGMFGTPSPFREGVGNWWFGRERQRIGNLPDTDPEFQDFVKQQQERQRIKEEIEADRKEAEEERARRRGAVPLAAGDPDMNKNNDLLKQIRDMLASRGQVVLEGANLG